MGGGISSAAYEIEPNLLILAELKSTSLPRSCLVESVDILKWV